MEENNKAEQTFEIKGDNKMKKMITISKYIMGIVTIITSFLIYLDYYSMGLLGLTKYRPSYLKNNLETVKSISLILLLVTIIIYIIMLIKGSRKVGTLIEYITSFIIGLYSISKFIYRFIHQKDFHEFKPEVPTFVLSIIILIFIGLYVFNLFKYRKSNI